MLRLLALLPTLVACGDNRVLVREDAPVDHAPDAAVVPGTSVSLRKVVELPGESPVLVASPPEDSRLFVVNLEGTIRIIAGDGLRPAPFLDVSSRVFLHGEAGLLGLAFHPQYGTNRRFFIYYTRSEPTDAVFILRDVVARCETTADPDVAEEASCVEILAIRDDRRNHNGGMIEFGADGFLYIGTGDGGGSGDPQGNAQTLTDGAPTSLSTALMGKLLRIDVDVEAGGKLYAIPGDNPFLASGAPEVYALGLRNPWRWSFDRVTGDIWIGDVGQLELEEIDMLPASALAGANFGWKHWEGNSCYATPCETGDYVFPIEERPHSAPDVYTAIIGGQVYRGARYPDLVGTYFYGDNRGGQLAAIIDGVASDLVPREGETFPDGISSIHEDASGELYVTAISTSPEQPSAIYHLEAKP